MPAIVRVVTTHYVYQINRTLPVPAGYPIEPFIIAEIMRTDDGFQLRCVPDPRDIEDIRDMFQDAESAQIYSFMAKKAQDDGIILMAEVPFTEDTRIETLMTQSEYDALPVEDEAADDGGELPDLPELPNG